MTISCVPIVVELGKPGPVLTGEDEKPTFDPNASLEDSLDFPSSNDMNNLDINKSMLGLDNINHLENDSETFTKNEISVEEEKFTCFICGYRYVFNVNTCIWFDHLSIRRKTCEKCIDCLTAIEVSPDLRKDACVINF